MKMVNVFSLTIFLGIVSSTLSQINSVTDPPITFDHVTTCSPSVESLVDSRFKLLAANFQDQIDDLKGKFIRVETSDKNANIGDNMKSQHQHEIQKRETKTTTQKPASSPRRPVCENSSSLCTFFHPDHPDAGSRKSTSNYSPTILPNATHLAPSSKVQGMPTSCKDLQLLGHKLNGFYLVKTASKSNLGAKIETVYCDFQLMQTNLNGKGETRIGIVDVKSSLVHFDVEGVNLYKAYEGNKIRYNYEALNVGKGFDWENGWFKAPYSGTYFFSISGTKETEKKDDRTCIEVQLNGKGIGDAISSDNTSYGSFSYQFTRKLNATDKIELFLKIGEIPYSIYFTGWMLDQALLV